MIEGIEPLYQRIGESIRNAIGEEWISAKMVAIFYPGTSTYLGEYVRKEDGTSKSFATGDDGERAFRELRKKFKQAGKPLWGRASFEIRSSGSFNMRFEYDDCDENGNAQFDEDADLKRAAERHNRLTTE